jgi:hypothetical protein
MLTLAWTGEALILIAAKRNYMVHLFNANAVHPTPQFNNQDFWVVLQIIAWGRKRQRKHLKLFYVD